MKRLVGRLAVLSLIMSLCVPAPGEPNGKGKWVRKESSGPARNFTLTDQDGQKVSLEDLRGKVTVVNFVFTYCPSGCPLTTAKWRSVQEALKDEPLHIVSVSIDPDHDTPPVLKAYGQKFGADFRRWSFLTGTKEEIERVRAFYKIPLERQAKRGPDGEIVSIGIVDHGLKTYVVDRQGMKRFEYWGQDFDPKVVIQDLTTLLGEGR
ncbi:MAG TPA: SCO family protein [Methylomirabilota bacterium]|jgi:protein SCO1/2